MSSTAFSGKAAAKCANASASLSCACTKECAMAPNSGMPKSGAASGGGRQSQPGSREEPAALRHGEHSAPEARLRQQGVERRPEQPRALDPVELLVAEAQAFEELERLLQARRHQEVAPRREVPHEKL